MPQRGKQKPLSSDRGFALSEFSAGSELFGDEIALVGFLAPGAVIDWALIPHHIARGFANGAVVFLLPLESADSVNDEDAERVAVGLVVDLKMFNHFGCSLCVGVVRAG